MKFTGFKKVQNSYVDGNYLHNWVETKDGEQIHVCLSLETDPEKDSVVSVADDEEITFYVLMEDYTERR